LKPVVTSLASAATAGAEATFLRPAATRALLTESVTFLSARALTSSAEV